MVMNDIYPQKSQPIIPTINLPIFSPTNIQPLFSTVLYPTLHLPSPEPAPVHPDSQNSLILPNSRSLIPLIPSTAPSVHSHSHSQSIPSSRSQGFPSPTTVYDSVVL